jgi:hypothetical protein
VRACFPFTACGQKKKINQGNYRIMKNIDHLLNVYAYEPTTRTFTIPVSVARYTELFNIWDPSPTHSRDLSPDLMAYLNVCSGEIPFGYPVNLALTISEDTCEPEREKAIIDGMKHFFQYEIQVISQKIRQYRQRSIKYAVMSFISLMAAILLRSILTENVLLDYIREGFTIGGWVFLWEAISGNFIQIDIPRHSIKGLKRLHQANILFNYPVIQ